MVKKYENPPIVEAVCEFRLTQDTAWDLTVPGLLYERLKSTFPYREQHLMHEIGITQGPQGLQQQVRTAERIVLFMEGRKLFAQIGPRLLAVNALRPYPTWSGFKPKIELVWQTLLGIVEVKGLERIGLRYINRIEIPESSIQLADYFDFYTFVGQHLPRDVVSFIAGAEFAFAGGRDHAIVQLTNVPSETAGITAFFLDIDYFLAEPHKVEISNVLAWVEQAHSQVEDVFEGCITDKLRNMFKEVK